MSPEGLGLTLWVRGLLCKCEALSLNPNNPAVVVYISKPQRSCGEIGLDRTELLESDR